MNRRLWLLGALSFALTACASMQQPQSVAQLIASDPQLSTLNGLIQKAGLGETLSGPGPFTVFAPSNHAFTALPQKTMGELAADPARLRQVLTFHVLPVKAAADDVKGGNVKTVNGANVSLSRSGTFVTVEDALVTGADKPASNGVVHVIDRVLLPPKSP